MNRPPIPPPDHRVEKLPRWAREHIHALERHAERLADKVERLVSGDPDSPVRIDAERLGLNPVPRGGFGLPTDSITFVVRGLSIEARVREDWLDITWHDQRMTHEGVVVPECSNRVRIVSVQREALP